MRPRPDPFELRAGALWLEDLDLVELTDALAAVSAAWLVSSRAFGRVLGAAPQGRLVDVHRVEPPALLGALAGAGWWARVLSSHELALARSAGFSPERIVAGGSVKDDGFLKDALTEGVAVLEPGHPDDAANVERIADGLSARIPPTSGGPPRAPADAFARCGGLMARVLRGPPDLAVDAPLLDAPDADVFPLTEGPLKAGSLEGLPLPGQGGEPPPAWIHGAPRRGDWVVVPSAAALGVQPGATIHPAVPRLLVTGSRWRVLETRPPVAPLEV